MKLKKGSVEAKRYMAKIRAMKSGTNKKATKTKSLGATKYVEKNETKKTKPKRTIKIERDTFGQFKKFKTLSGVHKDTKSHNVRINVLSGVDYLNEINHCINKIDRHKKFIEMNAYKLKSKTMNKETKSLLKTQIAMAKKYILSDKKRINELKKLI